METKSKSNLSNMEQKELSKLTDHETIVIKPADKGGTVVTLSTGHYQRMIMQHLLDEITYKKPRLLHRQQHTERPFKISKKV